VLDHLAPARRRLVIGLIGLVAAAVLALAAAVVLPRLGGSSVDPVPQDAQPPVLLVPGYGGGTAGLDVLAAALRHEGRDVTVVQLAGDGTGDLNVQARVVQDAVRRLVAAGAASVDLVGYSAGGVTVRLWARTYDGGSVARRIVTLGSPHHGTDLASLGADIAPSACPEACRQLATDSDLIRQLDRGDETPAGPRWVSIWTTDDQIVVPPSSSELDGALGFTLQSVCPGAVISHAELPQHPIVVAAVTRELAVAPPAVPGPEIC
jgi:triacylglycerol lipase